MNLKGRHLLTLKDFTKDEIIYLLDFADAVKAEKKAGIWKKRMANRNIALIFEKPSTRTRCAFAVACYDEGANCEYLGKSEIQLGHKESVEDTARVLGRMFDGIEFRGYSHRHVEILAQYSGVPVWNGLTDDDHPTQALADLMTVRERFGKLTGLRLVYVGDGRNNVANALMIAASKVGMDYTVVTPKELPPDADLVKECAGFAAASGSKIEVTDSIDGVKGADAVYTDVWVSMGEEAKSEERLRLLTPYRVDDKLMALAKPGAIFLHCLPAVKGNEVTEAVFERFADVVFDEAENRLHTIKAVMLASFGFGV
jgi:ornithine carbamoyltransferase